MKVFTKFICADCEEEFWASPYDPPTVFCKIHRHVHSVCQMCMLVNLLSAAQEDHILARLAN